MFETIKSNITTYIQDLGVITSVYIGLKTDFSKSDMTLLTGKHPERQDAKRHKPAQLPFAKETAIKIKRLC